MRAVCDAYTETAITFLESVCVCVWIQFTAVIKKENDTQFGNGSHGEEERKEQRLQ